MMGLSREKIEKIINDDWLLMDDCEGNKNCDVVKHLARMALSSLESRTVTVNPYPLATDKSQGWAIHPDFLHQIRERIGDDAENYDFSPSMEMVEAVLLAAVGINSGAQVGTVTVKLPSPLMPAKHNSGELFMTPDNVIRGGYLNRDDVLRNLRAAGIQVIEGEGQ